DVTPANPVVQRVEAPRPLLLGTSVERELQFSHFLSGVVGRVSRHALALTCLLPRDQSRAPSLQRFVAAFIGTTSPSDCRSTPFAFGARLMRPVFARRGLPRRVSRVPHLSFGSCRGQYPGEPHRPIRTCRALCIGLRGDMTRSALPITFRLII